MGIVFDTGEEGFRTVLRDWKETALKILWGSERGLTSRDVWIGVNRGLEGTRSMSRASIINFLNTMYEEGVLTFEEEKCKGGKRRRYSPSLDEEGFKLHVARTVISKLSEMWPDATREALLTSRMLGS
jgi:predicted transcriptional regulator